MTKSTPYLKGNPVEHQYLTILIANVKACVNCLTAIVKMFSISCFI